MSARLFLAMALVCVAVTGAYGCGVFRFGPPLETVWWRVLSDGFSILAMVSVLLAYFAGRAEGVAAQVEPEFREDH
jgi:hypothetical protein